MSTSEESNDRLVKELRAFVASFSRTRPAGRRSGGRAQFGHIHLPPYRLAPRTWIEEIQLAFSQVDKGTRLFFLVSPAERATVTLEELTQLRKHALPPAIMTYDEFNDVLRGNRADSGLQRGSFTRWKSLEQPSGWVDSRIIPWKAVLILQMDSSVSAACALALIGSVQWAIDISKSVGSRVRLLTMSADRSCDMLSSLIDLQAPGNTVSRLDLEAFSHETLHSAKRVDISTRDVPKYISNLVDDYPDSSHAVITFNDQTFGPRLTTFLAEQKRRCITYSLENEGDVLRESCRFREKPQQGAAIFNIVGGLPILPIVATGFTDVHVIMNPHRKRCQSWHSDAGQVVMTFGKCSREERRLQAWWSHQPYAKYTSIYTVGAEDDIEDFCNAGKPADRLIEGPQLGGFIAAVFDLSDWGIDARRTLSCFLRYHQRTAELMHRLEIQRVITQQALALTGSQAAAFRAALPLVAYDHRLALFISLDSHPMVRRVKVQMAVVLAIGVNSLIELIDDPRASSDPKQLFSRLLECCWGNGRSVAKQGTVYLALGLWKLGVRFKEEQTVSDPLKDRLDGLVEIDSVLANIVAGRADLIMEALKKEGIPIDDKLVMREHGDLDEGHFRQLRSHLLMAYIHQLAVSKRVEGGDNAAQGVELSHEIVSTLTALGPINQPRGLTGFINIQGFCTRERSDTIFGICQDLWDVGNEDGTFSADWTWIPAETVAQWKLDNAPNQDLCQALASGIQLW